MTDRPNPQRGLDDVQPVDSAALMADIRAEVERRRAAGAYPRSLDDLPPFADLGLDDELVASIHRLESLSRIPGITPVIEEVAPGPEGPVQPAGHEGRSRGAVMVDRGLVLARAVARRAVGPRLERVVRTGAEYLMASAHHGRIVVTRILANEARVARLEERLDALEERAGPS